MGSAPDKEQIYHIDCREDHNGDKTLLNTKTKADSSQISLEETKKITLDKAGLSESKVTFRETSFEYDDGMEVYQIEFVPGMLEYEVEINAKIM